MRRAFLRGAGIRQFIDIGSGLPTEGSTHEVAQLVDPRCRVFHVDEPVTTAHGELLLNGVSNTAFLRKDLREIGWIPHDGTTRRPMDFAEPIALLLFAALDGFELVGATNAFLPS